MSKGMKMYLFLLQSVGGKEITESYIAVKQAQINDTIADSAERVGEFGVIFTTNMNWVDVNDNLNIKEGEQYLLIELNENFASDKISGFFPDTNIEELKSLNLENLKDNAEWLESAIEKAVENENYEKAAKLKKKLDKKNKQED